MVNFSSSAGNGSGVETDIMGSKDTQTDGNSGEPNNFCKTIRQENWHVVIHFRNNAMYAIGIAFLSRSKVSSFSMAGHTVLMSLLVVRTETLGVVPNRAEQMKVTRMI